MNRDIRLRSRSFCVCSEYGVYHTWRWTYLWTYLIFVNPVQTWRHYGWIFWVLFFNLSFGFGHTPLDFVSLFKPNKRTQKRSIQVVSVFIVSSNWQHNCWYLERRCRGDGLLHNQTIKQLTAHWIRKSSPESTTREWVGLSVHLTRKRVGQAGKSVFKRTNDSSSLNEKCID